MSTEDQSGASKATHTSADPMISLLEHVAQGTIRVADAAVLVGAMKGVEQAKTPDSTASATIADVCQTMITSMRRIEDEKKEPWRAECEIYETRFKEMAQRSMLPTTCAKLQKQFEARVKGNFPIPAEVVFILPYLIYSESTVIDPGMFLADMLLNVTPTERLKMHNWCVRHNSPEQKKNKIAKAIASGKLVYPLFPCESLAYLNQALASEATQEMQDGAPLLSQAGVDMKTQGHRLFGTRQAKTPLLGGGPATSVGVYFPGNPEMVAQADTTPISDGMNELYNEIQRSKEQNANLKKQVAALEKKLSSQRAAMSTPGNSNYNNRGGYSGRGRGGNRGGNRGGYRGRGNGDNNYYGAGAEGEESYGYDDELYATGAHQEGPKNQ